MSIFPVEFLYFGAKCRCFLWILTTFEQTVTVSYGISLLFSKMTIFPLELHYVWAACQYFLRIFTMFEPESPHHAGTIPWAGGLPSLGPGTYIASPLESQWKLHYASKSIKIIIVHRRYGSSPCRSTKSQSVYIPHPDLLVGTLDSPWTNKTTILFIEKTKCQSRDLAPI